MNKEKLKICLRLVKEGHINETEFEQLMQTEKEYMSMPSDGTGYLISKPHSDLEKSATCISNQ